MGCHLHFYDAVNDKRSAEANLAGKPAGKYITWRETDARYYITFISPSSVKPEHIAVLRLPDGAFVLDQSAVQQGRFATLEDVILSRRYLDTSDGTDTSVSSSIQTHSTQTTVRSRTTASSSSSSNSFGSSTGVMDMGDNQQPGGLRTLPTALIVRRPTANNDDDDDNDEIDSNEWDIGVPPTCTDSTFHKIFECSWITSTFLFVLMGISHVWYGETLMTEDPTNTNSFSYYVDRTRSTVDTATGTLYNALRTLKDTTGNDGNDNNDNNNLLIEKCGQAYNEWINTLSFNHRQLQNDFESSNGPLYLASLIFILFFCSVMVMFLICLHTGRPKERLKDINNTKRTKPLCTPLQTRWSISFFSFLAVGIISGWLLLEAYWNLGIVSTAIENSARTLSVKFPTPGMRYMGTLPEDPQKALAILDEFAWRNGLWSSIVNHVHSPAACTKFIQDQGIDSLTHSPPFLKIPLHTVPPFSTITNTLFSPTILSDNENTALNHRSIDDKFYTITDPFRGTRFQGLIDIDNHHQWYIIIPSKAGAAHMTIGITAIVLIFIVAVLIVQEWWLNDGWPMVKSKLCGRRSNDDDIQDHLRNVNLGNNNNHQDRRRS